MALGVSGAYVRDSLYCHHCSRVTVSIGSAQPNFPPISDFAARAPTHAKAHKGASAGRTFERHRVTELPHLSRPIYDYLVEPPLHSAPSAAPQTHVRREIQSAVIPALVQGFDDALHRFHFDPFSRLEIQACRRRGVPVSARMHTEKHLADFPKQPCAKAPCHLQPGEVAG